MSKVVIYTTQVCPYCVRAKMLLKKKDIEFDEIDASDPKIREELLEKSGGMRTVPQIFIDEKHIGGCDDLYELDGKGELEKMLA